MKSNFNPKVCREDRDLVRCLIFMIEEKKADPYARMADYFEILLRSMRFGNVIIYEDEQGDVAGMACYSIGTAAADHEDTHVAHIDYCLMRPSLQKTFYFLKCLQFLVQTIMSEHPEVELIQLEAHDEVKHNNRLYSKFAVRTGQVQGRKGLLNVYMMPADLLQARIRRWEKKGIVS